MSTENASMNAVRRRRSEAHFATPSPSATLNRSRRRRSSPSGISETDSPDSGCHRQPDLLTRSLSFKSDESDGCQSFCPSDIEVKELLGKGCFGEVFKVVHRDTGVVMVLKSLYRMDPKCEKDFLKEAAFMRQLCHPNVVRFLGILYKDKKVHIISEFVSGGSLRSRLDDDERALSWTLRVRIAADISSGMSYLHSKNIVHRDLTSTNILLRQEDDRAVVADFGLARMLTRCRMSRKRRLTVVGNPYMMAPEMMNEKAYDERADVFSFGITLCEIIGRCSADPDVLTRTKNFGVDRESFLSKFAKDCPPPFYEIAFKCASVEPDDRPPFRLVFEWLTILEDSLTILEDSLTIKDSLEFIQFVEEIKQFSLNSDAFDTSTPCRPTSSLHRRKISLDLGYDSLSPDSRKKGNEQEIDVQNAKNVCNCKSFSTLNDSTTCNNVSSEVLD